MSLAQDIITDITDWAADAEKLATSAIPVVGAVTDALAAIDNVSKIFIGFQSAVQTPAMINASESEKLAAFHAHVQNAIQSGSEAELEKLESDSP